MKPIKLNFYQDSSHGWLKVPLKIIYNLGIEDAISGCSYYRKGFVYLEEDQDCRLFFLTIKEKYGQKIHNEFYSKVKSHWTNNSSKIRKYSHWENIDYNIVESYRDELLKSRNWGKKVITQITNATVSDLRYWHKTFYTTGLKF